MIIVIVITNNNLDYIKKRKKCEATVFHFYQDITLITLSLGILNI